MAASDLTEGAGLRCIICLEDLSSELEGEKHREEGWGVTNCCDKSFHYSCMGHWLSQKDLVESTCGPMPMARMCPTCNRNVPKTKSRMLRKRLVCE